MTIKSDQQQGFGHEMRFRRRALLRLAGGDLAAFAQDRLGCLTSVARERGPVAPMRLGAVRALLLSDPDDIEAVLTGRAGSFGKHYLPTVGASLLGNGLFNSTGELWRRQRRLMLPAFHRARIAGYGDTMVRFAGELADEWRGGGARDVDAEMMALTLRIVGDLLFHADVAGDAREVGAAMETVRRCFVTRLEALVPLPARVPSPANRRLAAAARTLDAIVQRIVAERRSAGDDRGDVLSMLLAARDDEGKPMDDRQVRDEMMNLFLGGHETTAIALTWTWYLVATHPAVQEDVLAEIRDVVGERPPTAADVPQLVRTERAIREAMRLYPPVYAFDRKALPGCELRGRPVSPGTVMIVSPYVVQRDPAHFTEPDVFRPERWADERGLHKYAYMPFGGGPRVCIGNRFAQMEMVLVLATMLPRVAIAAGPDLAVPDPSITLKPRGGLTLHVGSRISTAARVS